jgi:hypothetical protein
MKSLLNIAALTFVMLLSNCTLRPAAKITPTVSRRSVLAPEIDTIRVVIGETPANDANAILGTWRLENFMISSNGSLAGKCTVRLTHPGSDIPNYQDFLLLQIWAFHIWPQHGDMTIRPAGKLIPVKASFSDATSAAFDIDGKFEIPPLMIDTDGGMPLDHIQVTMVWYRISRASQDGLVYYRAKIGTPENLGDQPWRGIPLFDQTVSLSGTIDSHARDRAEYSEWFMTNLPTSTPNSESLPYPAPQATFPPIPSQSYPPPRNSNP